MRCIVLSFWLVVMLAAFACCSAGSDRSALHVQGEGPVYSVYLMSRGIHTGLIIPVNGISKSFIAALGYFEKAGYVDFGWGEEEVYQTSNETCCMDLRAVTIPSSSVMRLEVFPGEPESLAAWSGYTVAFRLTESEFRKICAYIDEGFTRDSTGQLVRASVRSGGDIIFFKSVHTYCGFNTCNTWAADALHAAGLEVSSFMVLTEGNLYNEVKRAGIILKSRD